MIAELLHDTKIKVIDEAWSPPIVNQVPSKFLEKFATPELAYRELEHLTTFGHDGHNAAQVVTSESTNAVRREDRHDRSHLRDQQLEVRHGPVDSNLLRISLREQGGIPFKCGGGLCGTCKCLIEKGLENTDAIKPKERKHLTEEQFAAGYRMACQTFLNGDVSVSWTPKPAAAGARPVPASPAPEFADRLIGRTMLAPRRLRLAAARWAV